jgi:hypothetical protein
MDLIVFFREPGDVRLWRIGTGTRPRRRQQNLIVAIQESVHNLLCGQSYLYLLATEARISETEFAGFQLQSYLIYWYNGSVILSDMGDLIA